MENLMINLLEIIPEEEGGNNAIDGFDFQEDALMKIFFDRITQEKDYHFIYEHHEDFVIVEDKKIELYQAKSADSGKNITFSSIHPGGQKAKKPTTLEKVIKKHNKIKLNFEDTVTIENFLVVPKERNFGSQLFDEKGKDIISLKESKAKDLIIDKIDDSEDILDKIFIYRLIFKYESEIYIKGIISEKVYEIIGESLIDVSALYKTFREEIKKSRKMKVFISKEDILSLITKYSNKNIYIPFKDVSGFLDDADSKDIQLSKTFRSVQTLVNIKNTKESVFYQKVKLLLYEEKASDFYFFFQKILNEKITGEEIKLLSVHTIKSIILLAIEGA